MRPFMLATLHLLGVDIIVIFFIYDEENVSLNSEVDRVPSINCSITVWVDYKLIIIVLWSSSSF